MLNSLSSSSPSSSSSSSSPPILVICDLQPDLLGSLDPTAKQDLLDGLSIVIEAARKYQWNIFYSALQFSKGYERVPQTHKLYGAFAKLHQKLGDSAVHWFLEGWEGSQILKEPATVAPRTDVDTVVTREQHLPLELIESIIIRNHHHNDASNQKATTTANGDGLLLQNGAMTASSQKKVYLTGAKASGSVQITAQMLMDQGFQVCGIDEAIQDDSSKKRQAVLEHILPIYGDVVSLQEFVEQMGGLETFSNESQQTFVEYYKNKQRRRRQVVEPQPQPSTTTTVGGVDGPTKQSVPKSKDDDSTSLLTKSTTTDNINNKQTFLVCNCGRRGHGAKYMELLINRNYNATTAWQTYPTQIWYEDMVRGVVYQCPLGKQVVHFCDEPEFSRISMYLLGREWLDEKDKFLEIANVDDVSADGNGGNNNSKSYMPKTYCFEKGQWRNGLAPSPEEDGPWFVKEANKNLGGAAIHIVSKTSEIAQHLLFPNDRRYVVQAHIRDPLLTEDGNKTHIKFYVLLVCDDDADKASGCCCWTLYTYKASLLSISPNPWSPTDLSHDTQVTIHRHPEPPGETKGWKQHDWEKIYQKCKQGTAHIIQRAIAMGKLQGRKLRSKKKHQIGKNTGDKDEKNNSIFQKQFEVFSVDWMPDTHGNVWVLECNFSPAIAQPEFKDPSHRDARRDYLMKHDEIMLKEALEIVMPSSSAGSDKPTEFGQWDLAGTFHSE